MGAVSGRKSRGRSRGRRLVWVALFGVLLSPLAEGAELKPEARAAYQRYIEGLEGRLDIQNHSKDGFLWIDGDPARLKLVRSGEIATAQVNTFSTAGAMVQHWIGGEFLPGVTLEKIAQLDMDYTDYGKYYGPDLSHPKVLEHGDNHFVVSYRITKKKVLTATMETVHSINYIPLGPDRMAVKSRSISVRQVEDAGTPSEHLLAEGEGFGFLWAMNSYWRMEERDGGIYLECEAVTLSRDVPFGMHRLVNPILQSFAEEALHATLASKKRALAAMK